MFHCQQQPSSGQRGSSLAPHLIPTPCSYPRTMRETDPVGKSPHNRGAFILFFSWIITHVSSQSSTGLGTSSRGRDAADGTAMDAMPKDPENVKRLQLLGLASAMLRFLENIPLALSSSKSNTIPAYWDPPNHLSRISKQFINTH